jgi:hypothetical protein
MNKKTPNKYISVESFYFNRCLKILNEIQAKNPQINFDSLAAREMIAKKISSTYRLNCFDGTV